MRLARRQVLAGALVLAVAHGASANDAPTADAQARWLAGLEPLRGIEPSAEWRAYAASEKERWAAAEPRVRVMQEWAARELAPLCPTGRPLFYPFAGPDVLHALSLFGPVAHVVLVGLEPVGALPEPSRPPAAGYFARLGAAQADVHRLTFFRTQEMSADFQRDGVVAALLATIVRMSGKISAVQLVSGPASVRIDWIAANGAIRRLDYVQADLSNGALAAQPQLVANLRALAPYVSFLKAAMFLLAEPRFSYLRQVLLEDSAVLVQDDTGIPFRWLDGKGWALRLFGRYEAPGTPFEARTQEDLRAAFERRGVGSLPFGIGYHVQARSSNLLVASAAAKPPPPARGE